MKSQIDKLTLNKGIINKFKEIRERKTQLKVYESSLIKKSSHLFFLIREDDELKFIILSCSPNTSLLRRFRAIERGKFKSDGKVINYSICSCSHENALELRKTFHYTAPQVIGITPAIGMGDRIGLATPGHIRAAKKLKVFPVLAQQSIREMDRTLRTPKEVLDDASWGVFQEGYHGGFGADADHLKTLADIDVTFEAGFRMFTIDPSDYVDNEADHYNIFNLRKKYEQLPWDKLECSKDDYYKIYLKRNFIIKIPEEEDLRLFEESLLRAAVKYSSAIAYAVHMYRYLKRLFGKRRFDFEMSVDETKTPTSPLEHFFIVSEMKRLDVPINSLALRFVGKFEKAIDYIGDLKAFEDSFMKHVNVVKAFKSYKLSIHSGSDKFSIYSIVGKLALNMVHLKTAGTSYLEALRIVARHSPTMFRDIIRYGLEYFKYDRKSYSVSTNLSLIPDPEKVPDEDLEKVFLDENNGRQMLHITYGSVLTAKKQNGEWLFRESIRRLLTMYEEEHYTVVAAHMERHIKKLWK